MTATLHKIRHPDDAQWAALDLRHFAEQHGASQSQAWELATVISELVNNVLKYARDGDFTYALVLQPRRGLRLEVCDRGPGIENLDFSLQDGVSQGQRMFVPGVDTLRDGQRSLGHGLGAVRRLMDDVQIENRKDGGLKVVCIKFF